MEPRAEIAALATRLMDAWNRADAVAFSRLFTDSAAYISGNGQRHEGSAAIARLVAQADRGSQVSIQGSPSVELEDSTAGLTFGWLSVGGGGAQRRGIIACRVVRRGNGWLIERLQNTEAQQ